MTLIDYEQVHRLCYDVDWLLIGNPLLCKDFMNRPFFGSQFSSNMHWISFCNRFWWTCIVLTDHLMTLADYERVHRLYDDFGHLVIGYHLLYKDFMKRPSLLVEGFLWCSKSSHLLCRDFYWLCKRNDFNWYATILIFCGFSSIMRYIDSLWRGLIDVGRVLVDYEQTEDEPSSR